MFGLIGIVVIFVMVFGGYLLAGGKLGIILKSLPFEMMMIGGAAIGAFLISNDMSAVKQTAKDIGKVFKGPKWKPDDYRDLLCLLFSLIRIARQNPVSLEAHMEDPNRHFAMLLRTSTTSSGERPSFSASNCLRYFSYQSTQLSESPRRS